MASSVSSKKTSKPKREPESSGNTDIGKFVSIRNIKLPAKQPRRSFNAGKLKQLVESVRKHGILEPLIVRPLTARTYELVAGERRYRAAKEVGLAEVPVVIRELDEQQAFEIALLENLQRDDLNPIDETEGMLELLCQSLGCDREYLIGLLNQAANAKRRDQPLTDDVTRQLKTVDDVFLTVGRQGRESFRTNRLPLLNLPEDVLVFLRAGELEYTKAKAIAKLKTENERCSLMEKAIEERMSLSEIKKVVKKMLHGSQDLPVDKKDLWAEFQTIAQMQSNAWVDEEKRQKIQSILDELRYVLEIN